MNNGQFFRFKSIFFEFLCKAGRYRKMKILKFDKIRFRVFNR